MTLPLRDYYPIERAAKLLDCDIDDLIHWAVTGCIRICIKIESAYGVLNIPDEKMWLISIVCVSLWIQNHVNHGYLTLMPFQKGRQNTMVLII